MIDERPGWCEYFTGIAAAIPVRADCIRRKVGAVITYKHRIVASGYNGTKVPGLPGCLSGACPRGHLTYEEQPEFQNYGNCISNHAERNAVEWLLEHSDIALDQTQIHITCQPCPDCQALLDEHGIAVCYPGMPGSCPVE